MDFPRDNPYQELGLQPLDKRTTSLLARSMTACAGVAHVGVGPISTCDECCRYVTGTVAPSSEQLLLQNARPLPMYLFVFVSTIAYVTVLLARGTDSLACGTVPLVRGTIPLARGTRPVGQH